MLRKEKVCGRESELCNLFVIHPIPNTKHSGGSNMLWGFYMCLKTDTTHPPQHTNAAVKHEGDSIMLWVFNSSVETG